jgi:hypothetical protein
MQVLKNASEKFPDFVASNLAPGVLEAFNFQSRLWAAKHSGQPLPKGEATVPAAAAAAISMQHAYARLPVVVGCASAYKPLPVHARGALCSSCMVVFSAPYRKHTCGGMLLTWIRAVVLPTVCFLLLLLHRPQR